MTINNNNGATCMARPAASLPGGAGGCTPTCHITLAYQIITCGIQAARKKAITGLKIHPIIINFVVGVFISLLFLVWQ